MAVVKLGRSLFGAPRRHDTKHKNPEGDTTVLDQESDRLVYDLYSLTLEEMGIVEAGA